MKENVKLDLYNTEIAIKYLKDTFEKELAEKLNLIRVSAPLFVTKSSGLNDNLNGVEVPVSFNIKGIDDEIEIVHSLAKWKREALARYKIENHQGIYTDMNAIRKDETLDELHSLYVDQWDYEIRINKEDRNLDYLFKIVNDIYDVLKDIEVKINKKYPILSKKLPDKITFISTLELESMYKDLDRKERENKIVKRYGAVFLYKIGYDLLDGAPHDGRAPDYDDWDLNGDIILYNKVLDKAFEISSMGIRVDSKSIIKQINIRKPEMINSPFVKKVINNELPLTLGGGIGQSRLCMFYLEKHHIGEVQASIWPEEEIEKLKEKGIILL